MNFYQMSECELERIGLQKCPLGHIVKKTKFLNHKMRCKSQHPLSWVEHERALTERVNAAMQRQIWEGDFNRLCHLQDKEKVLREHVYRTAP